jgi:ubiquinone/menaquinone biosynthesis C-methylase UbiE
LEKNQAIAINSAFSKQSARYDEADERNIVLKDMRKQVYHHVNRFLKPGSHILELNAGTGIDALQFIHWGHQVLATDLSDGMIHQINHKIEKHQLHPRLRCQQLSYDKLDQLHNLSFDFVFSNFGGLNCIQNLESVTRHLPPLLKPGAFVTWVVMPPVCLWEITGLLRGHGKKAFRRFNQPGVPSHLEGEFFLTYYHSLKNIKAAFKKPFRLIAFEGLAALSPQPHNRDFPIRFPVLYKNLRKLDSAARTHFPFDRWADHLIVTFQYTP